jgi:transcriptional regulator GlxA family with amidase domain
MTTSSPLGLEEPLDAFDAANAERPGSYVTLVATLDGVPSVSEAGLKIAPDRALADAGPWDMLLLPGRSASCRHGSSPCAPPPPRPH